jgi:hypothetical protein
MRRYHGCLLGIVLTAVLITGCHDGGTGPDPEDPLFDRYVAVGNSITAAFESEGINDSTQNHAYPVVFARRFQAPFAYPRIRKPGCPAPLVGPIALTTERVRGARATDCALVHLPLPSVNHNLAFPGATIGDALTAPGSTGTPGYDLFLRELYSVLFGGRTLIQAMVNANPTLVSVWLGNNDALSAVTAGDIDRLTPLADFVRSLDQIVNAIADNTRAQDAIWLGVADPRAIPLAQPGAYYWALHQDEATRPWLGGKPVNANCAPFVGGGQNPQAANLVSARIVRDPNITEISCADDAPYLLNPAERQAVHERVVAFNDAIRSRAEQRGWIYIDTNAMLARHLHDPDRIRKCQGLATARNLAEFETAVRASCPHPDAPTFYGSLVSFDGIHPSAEGQRIVADEMEAAVRAKHGI